jgi:hypothetical protein
MKSRYPLLAILALSLMGLTACSEETASSEGSGHAYYIATQTTCPVSSEPLGSMGEPIIVTHEGKEVQLCCKSCIKKFNAAPATYAAKVHGS